MVWVTGLSAKVQGSLLDGKGTVMWGSPCLKSIHTSSVGTVFASIGDDEEQHLQHLTPSNGDKEVGLANNGASKEDSIGKGELLYDLWQDHNGTAWALLALVIDKKRRRGPDPGASAIVIVMQRILVVMAHSCSTTYVVAKRPWSNDTPFAHFLAQRWCEGMKRKSARIGPFVYSIRVLSLCIGSVCSIVLHNLLKT